MTPFDYGLKEPKRRGESLSDPRESSVHCEQNHSNRFVLSQIETGSGPVGKRKHLSKRCWKQKQDYLQSDIVCELYGQKIVNIKPKKQKTFFPLRFSQLNSAPLYAALDLGTNNCRLLIASPSTPGSFRVVDAFSRIVRLGEGLESSGFLSSQAMDRTIEALKVCRWKLESKSIKRYRFVATEACRVAKNGKYFIQRVLDETGLELEIVNRETEARFAVSGCGSLVEPNTDAIVLFDIGGGSSEIVLLDVSQKRSLCLAKQIIAWTSLPVGVVTLAERFGGRDVSLDDFERMKSYVRSFVNNFSDRYKLGSLAQGSKFYLLGTSGTTTTLAGVYLNLKRYNRRLIDGIWMDNADITLVTKRLLSWDIIKRAMNPCIGQERADLVLAGCAILDVIREVWPTQRLRVADRGVREGILTELMLRDGVWRYRKNRYFRR